MVDRDDGPIPFPRRMSGLHERCGLSIDALARQTGLLGETIADLTGGSELCSWEVTSVYLDACGQDVGQWRLWWEQEARDRRWRVWPRRHTPVGRFPDPATANTDDRLRELMEHLRQQVGLTYKTLEERAKDQRRRLPHATANAVVKGRGRLERELVEAFAAACGLPQVEVRRWRLAWQRIVGGGGELPGRTQEPAQDGSAPAPAAPPGVLAGNAPLPPPGLAAQQKTLETVPRLAGTTSLQPDDVTDLNGQQAAGTAAAPADATPETTDTAPTRPTPGSTPGPTFTPPEDTPDSAGGAPDGAPEYVPDGAPGRAFAARSGGLLVSRRRPRRATRPARTYVGAAVAAVALFLAGDLVGNLEDPAEPTLPTYIQVITTSPYPITASRPVTIALPPVRREDWWLDLRLRLGYAPEQALETCSHRAWLTYSVITGGRALPAARSQIGQHHVAVNGLRLGKVRDASVRVTLNVAPSHREIKRTKQVGRLPDSPCRLTIDPGGTVLRTARHPAPPLPAPASHSRLAGRRQLKIAVKIDQPGIGEIINGDPDDRRGLDIDIATHIAEKLGAKSIEWHDVTSQNREMMITSGRVDMVVASYGIYEFRHDLISFAGPYLVAGQDILVRAADTSITKVGDLKSKKVCGVTGSGSTQRLVDNLGAAWGESDHLIKRNGYAACVTELLNRTVDAVSTDNSILAGFAAEFPGRLRLVNRPFSNEEYGIGLPKDDIEDAARISAILKQMIDDGTWAAIVKKNLGAAADPFLAAPPIPQP